MIRIGIVGAENSHTAAIARICNIDKLVKAKVVSVWGETRAFAEAAAEKGQIPAIVEDWREMLGQVDGIMIDHRDAKHHYEVAEFFLSNKVPTFVDKPFTDSLKSARALCSLAKRKKTAVTTMSVIPLQKHFQKIKKDCAKLGAIKAASFKGPADLKSKYGGIFFYGIHQVDAMVELFGTNIRSVQVVKDGSGQGGVGVVEYNDGPQVALHFIPAGFSAFHFSIGGEKGVIDQTLERDANSYLSGTKTFLKMFRTGNEPYDRPRMLAPVAVLESMQTSLKTGKPVRVPKL